MKQLLEEQNKLRNLQVDQFLSVINKRISNIWGPLSQLWSYIENKSEHVKAFTRGEREQCQQEIEQAKEVSALTDERFVILGQVMNSTTDFKRFNGSSIFVSNPKEVENIYKD